MSHFKKELLKCKHPNSRRIASIAKQVKKKNNRDNAKIGYAIKQNLVGEKIQWFKDHLIPDVKCYSPEQTEDVINLYLSRFNEELEQINIKHSVGNRKSRQHANREDVIKLTIKREHDEYNTCGIEMPDLMNVAQLEMLRKWNGELRFLQNFKLRRIGKKYLMKEINKNNVIGNVQSISTME